jgi:hypothetical protein
LNASGVVAQSSDLILHKDYDPDNFLNDIGLIQLSTPLTFTRYLCGAVRVYYSRRKV